MTDEQKTEATEKKVTKKAKLPLAEARKQRKASRKARREMLAKKLSTDMEFKKTFFAAKRTRAAARVSAFKKAKSGKK